MSKDYRVQGTCFFPAWKNILLHLWITRLAKTFALSQRHVPTCALDAIKLGLAIVQENGRFISSARFGALRSSSNCKHNPIFRLSDDGIHIN